MAFDRGIGSAGTGTSRGVVDRVATVETISDLKSYTGPEDAVIVQGYSTVGDGGGGEFYWDSTSTTTANDGTIIQATGVSTGRWIRIYSGGIHADWFGGDVKAAYDSLTSGVLYLGAKTYTTTQKISLKANCSIIGTGINSSVIDASAGTHTVFEATEASGTAYRSQLSDFKILGNSTGDNIYVNNVSYFHILRMDIVNGVNGVRYVNDSYLCSIRDSLIELASDYGIYFDEAGSDINVNSFDNIQFNANVKIHIYVAASASYGNNFTNCNFNAGGVSVWGTEGSYGNTISGCAIEIGSGLTQSLYIGNKRYGGAGVSAPLSWKIYNNTFTGAGTPTYNVKFEGGSNHTFMDNDVLGTPTTAHVLLDTLGGANKFLRTRNPSGGTKPIYAQTGTTNAMIESGVTTVLTFTDGATTPSILPDQQAGGNTHTKFKTANTAPTNLTSFADAMDGHEFTVIFGDANTTVKFTSGVLVGNGGADWTPTANDSMHCVWDSTIGKACCLIS